MGSVAINLRVSNVDECDLSAYAVTLTRLPRLPSAHDEIGAGLP